MKFDVCSKACDVNRKHGYIYCLALNWQFDEYWNGISITLFNVEFTVSW